LLADKGGKGVADVAYSVEDAVDCPTVRSESGIVQFIPEDRN
jgi:hypothetical protein